MDSGFDAPPGQVKARVIDGKAIADRLLAEVAAQLDQFMSATGTRPTLAVVMVGEDPASQIYVRRKRNAARKVGILPVERRLGAETTHPVNVGRLSIGTSGLVPCTPLGCMRLLDTVIDDFRGLAAVVIGKSNIVGKPIALLLLERECTVTVTHILTRGLPDIVRTADIVVVAAGSPRLVRGDWVKPGAVVIDVGINRIEDGDGSTRIVGDAATDELSHAAAVTPVPGGVGPMTVACLLSNTMKAAAGALNPGLTVGPT